MAGNVQFILGRAGTGKSRVIQERIVALLRADPLGPPVYLLVPAQATFVHERFYALAAGVEGYARLRVVSFENLGEDVIAECGGEAMVQVSAAGRQMLLGHLLRTHAEQLTYFRPVARQLGLVAELDRTFAELERAGRSSSELYEALPQMLVEESAPEYAGLIEKTRDLALLGDLYRKALGEGRLDATRRLEHVLKNLEQCQGLRQAHLFVDGFFRFSAFERKLLARLAGAVNAMYIALTLDPRHIEQTIHETDLFYPTVTTFRQLMAELEQARVAVAPPIELETTRRFKSPALALIEQDWSMPRPSIAAGVDASAVRLTEAPDPRAEADAAARQVRAWLEEGFRLRDIAVLCRDLSTMQPLLEASFREHDLPFFTDRRRPAAHHPLVRFVRSALRIATRSWPHDSVMELCKCGLAGMALADADALENFTLEHRIRGKGAWTAAADWKYSRIERDDDESAAVRSEDAAAMDSLRRRLAGGIIPLAEALGGDPRPVRDHLKAVWACLEHFEVRRRLEGMIEEATAAGHLEEAAEHAQAWDELLGLLEQTIELLGEEKLAGDDFVATLEYGLDLLDLAIIPPAADEVVIGDVERSRVLGCRAAVVMGLNDGTFPRSNTDATVLADEERRLLRKNHVDVDPEGRSLQLAERFLAYRAFTTASERLTLTRSAADGEGRPASPSPYWLHVQSLLGVEPKKLGRESAEEPSSIGTPRQLAAVLMRWARGGADDASAGPAALYQVLAGHQDLDGPLGVIRRLSWRALSYENRAVLKPETAKRLFRDELSTSVSRLEAFAKCPFSHYAAHVLKLRGREDADEVTARDMGTLYHGVLEHLVRGCINAKLHFVDPASITPERIQELTREIGEKLRGQIMLSNARNQYLLKRIETVLQGVVASQQAVLRRGKLTPLRTELRFGEGQGAELGPLELPTPAGRKVRLYGQIDRVDHHPPSGYAVVVDYKHGGSELKLDHVTYGLSLQLLVYLLVLQRNGASLADPPPQPAAALYVKLLRGIESRKHPSEGASPGEPAFDLRVKPRGVIDADALSLIDADYFADEDRKGFSDAYSVAMSADGKLHRNPGNDLVESGDLDLLLAEVEKQVIRLADDLMEGVIDVRPYKMGTETPCPWCEFRPLCRFDPSQGNYLLLQPRKKWDVLAEIRGQPAPDHGEEEE